MGWFGRLAQRSCRPAVTGGGLVAFGLAVAVTASGQVIGFRAGELARRQPAPAAENLPASDVIEADAFALLTGPRPDFTAKTRDSGGPAAAPADGSAAWSSLVSGATLADEVKLGLPPLQQATASQTAFNSSVEAAIDRFSIVAVTFGVMAVYDKPNDLRSSWRAAAAGLRDRFARVAHHCDRDGPQAYAEARARTTDLEALIFGETIAAEPDGEPPQWSQLCDRAVLMRRLETADGILKQGTATKEAFAEDPEKLLHEAELVAVLGRLLVQKAFTDWDDDTYRDYSATMQQAALNVRAALQKGDHEAARTAASAITQACSTCHGDYR